MRQELTVDPSALRRARQAAGLTQHELAYLVEVAGGERISRWELGSSSPRPAVLRRLARALGVSVSDLLVVTDDDPDLRRLRTAAGLSGRQLAACAHVSVPTLARWEAGRFRRTPDLATLELLATALGMEVPDVQRALERSRERLVRAGSG